MADPVNLEKTASQQIVTAIMEYKKEAEQAKQRRMQQNDRNHDVYHLLQDWSHKLKDQSQEFLPRQSMAIEQISQFVHQGLVEMDAFFSADPKRGVKKPLFSKDEARNLLADILEKGDFFDFTHDSIKSGLLGSLIIAKIYPKMVPKTRYYTRTNRKTDETKLYRDKKTVSQVCFDLIRQKNYFPDPTNEKLYKVELIEKDLWEVLQMAEQYSEEFDPEAVKMLKASANTVETINDQNKARETGQNATMPGFRKRVQLLECWGKILDPYTGEVIHDRVRSIIAADRFLIMPPQPYPFWTNEDPYVEAPLIRVPHSVWHKALADAPTSMNIALNEIFNLILDGGIQSVFGIKQLREYWLEDPSQVADGVMAGSTLSVNQSCPPGGKVVERVDTSGASNEGIGAFELASREFNSASLTNDLRLGGMPARAVKATEVVEASQSITSVFTGIGASLENNFIKKVLEKAWNISMQELKRMDKDDLIAVLGEKKVESVLEMPDKKIFAQTVNGHQFHVFGITQTLNKIKDYRKLTAMLQTISGNGPLAEAFNKEFSFTKLLGKIMTSLDVDTDEIKHDEADQAMNDMAMQQEGADPSGAPAGPDMQSQTPQASTGGDGQYSGMAQTEFPN